MTPPISKRCTTDPEYSALFNYIIERTENVKSPNNIEQLIRDFKGKSGAVLAITSFKQRIKNLCTMIPSFEYIDTETKVKILFALSAPVDTDFLEELKEDAVVEIDDKNRITLFKAINGSLDLKSDHSRSAKVSIAKLESKGSLRSLIRNYFENKNKTGAIPKNKEEKEMRNFIEFITERCDNVNSPLNITQLAKDFNNHFGLSRAMNSMSRRVKTYCREIQTLEFLDTHSKVKQLFGLSATLDSKYLEELRKNALVEIDDEKRIIHYKANDGNLELRGDHSLSSKIRTAKLDLESKPSYRPLIISYFEKNVDAVPKNKEEKAMWNLIEFITEKCENIDSPLNILQLNKDFNKKFGISVSLENIQYRIESYGHEIQKAEFLGTPSKVRQLFGLGVKLDSYCLKELRKDAVVEVDNLNRITKYTANNGRLILHGYHSSSANINWIERRKNKKKVKKHFNSGGDTDEESENENGYSEDDSDEYSSEEFDSEFDSDGENDHLDETEDHMDSSTFESETPTRNRLSIDMSTDDNFDFDPPTGRSSRTEEIEVNEDEEIDPGITKDAEVETRRFVTLPKSKTSSPTSHTPKTPKRKAASSGSNSSKRTKPSSDESTIS